MPTVWSRYTPPERTTWRRCSWRSSRIARCARETETRGRCRRHRTEVLAPESAAGGGFADVRSRSRRKRLLFVRPGVGAASRGWRFWSGRLRRPPAGDARQPRTSYAGASRARSPTRSSLQRDAVERALDVGGDDERRAEDGAGPATAAAAPASVSAFFFRSSSPPRRDLPRSSRRALRSPSRCVARHRPDERPELRAHVVVVRDVRAHHARPAPASCLNTSNTLLKAGVHGPNASETRRCPRPPILAFLVSSRERRARFRRSSPAARTTPPRVDRA